MYKSEEYLKQDQISYRHVLTSDEKGIMANIIHHVLNKCDGPTESIPFVENSLPQLTSIMEPMNHFFQQKPGNYFVRLSTCSPKDAWYQLFDNDTETNDTETNDLTTNDVRRDLNVLNVSSAKQCLMVLCHSERIYYEVEFGSTEIAVLLVPWRDDILHDTETRCFVKNRKLFAFCQYYSGLENGYESVDKYFVDFYPRIIEYLDVVVQKMPYDDAVIDITLCNNILEPNHIRLVKEDFVLVEFNPFNENTDASLFEWEQLHQIHTDNNSVPLFRYKKNGQIVDFPSFVID